MSNKASAEPVCASELVTYTVYVTNSGHLATSRPFTLTVDLDNGVEFAAAESPLPVHSDGMLTWGNIDTILDPGEAIQRTFWVTVSPGMEQDDVLAHLARTTSPQDVMPDGTLAITSTVWPGTKKLFWMILLMSFLDKRMSCIDKNILSLMWSEKMSLPMRYIPDTFQL